MVERQEQHSRSLGDQHPLLDEILTLGIRETLASLALMSEDHMDIADVVAKHAGTLRFLVERHPHFAGSSLAMLIKLAHLHALHEELGQLVMHHSHLLENAIVALETQNQEIRDRP